MLGKKNLFIRSTPGGRVKTKVFPVISMVCPAGKWPALQTLVAIVYRMADLQGSKYSDVSLTLHCGSDLTSNGCYCTLSIINTYHYIFLYHLQASQQVRYIQRPQHGVLVRMTSILRQRRQLKASKVVPSKLVEEVCNLFGR